MVEALGSRWTLGTCYWGLKALHERIEKDAPMGGYTPREHAAKMEEALEYFLKEKNKKATVEPEELLDEEEKAGTLLDSVPTAARGTTSGLFVFVCRM